ncbi:MAG: metallophosphoesterase, partial [Akkermansiaceae bacterium]|nr:metallophosphoesterase [Armatimonadota bacterium]
RALTESERDRPTAWRIVYLHHPLYTSINNRCERPDVQGVRANIMPVLQRHDVHVVLAGHSHAFEWIRSSALPNAGLFVTGGGGQISLRPSLLEPKRLPRLRRYYDALRAAGAQECVMAGHGPAGADGDAGLLYHYLRVSVTPEAITVRPVGVRRLGDRTYRREEPMRVFHAPHLPVLRPRWEVQTLSEVVVRRDGPPRAQWV